jgi:hypothetical protein
MKEPNISPLLYFKKCRILECSRPTILEAVLLIFCKSLVDSFWDQASGNAATADNHPGSLQKGVSRELKMSISKVNCVKDKAMASPSTGGVGSVGVDRGKRGSRKSPRSLLKTPLKVAQAAQGALQSPRAREKGCKKPSPIISRIWRGRK